MRIDGIEDQLADPTLYERDPKAVAQLGKERSEISNSLATNEDRWLTLSTEYEEAMAG